MEEILLQKFKKLKFWVTFFSICPIFATIFEFLQPPIFGASSCLHQANLWPPDWLYTRKYLFTYFFQIAQFLRRFLNFYNCQFSGHLTVSIGPDPNPHPSLTIYPKMFIYSLFSICPIFATIFEFLGHLPFSTSPDYAPTIGTMPKNLYLLTSYSPYRLIL